MTHRMQSSTSGRTDVTSLTDHFIDQRLVFALLRKQGGHGASCTHLQGLLCQIDVLDVEQALAQGRHPPVPDDGGAGGGQVVCQVRQGACRQQHDVRIVVSLQQADLQPRSPLSVSLAHRWLGDGMVGEGGGG